MSVNIGYALVGREKWKLRGIPSPHSTFFVGHDPSTRVDERGLLERASSPAIAPDGDAPRQKGVPGVAEADECC